ncbi:MAG: sulfate adenylyltransferase [Zetaproteobacteria bacterium CG1_02_53_45]|nr:MAG: sulfate adenylyltransferase [Zetaproteobacteria bacterium CG1_02_53_45]
MLVFAWLILAVSITTAGNGGFSPEFLDNIASQFGQRAKQRIIDWQQLIEESKGDSEWQTINAVNAFFNRIDFISDELHWGQVDYWATPVEMLSTNGGDCEDFSIAKYFTLLELGVPDERLRITYVKALELNQAHMVLAYYETPESEPLILDNLINKIRSASQRSDLLPVYSFNGNNLWMSKERGQGRAIVGGSQRINLWRDLNIRIKQERERGSSYTAQDMAR